MCLPESTDHLNQNSTPKKKRKKKRRRTRQNTIDPANPRNPDRWCLDSAMPIHFCQRRWPWKITPMPLLEFEGHYQKACCPCNSTRSLSLSLAFSLIPLGFDVGTTKCYVRISETLFPVVNVTILSDSSLIYMHEILSPTPSQVSFHIFSPIFLSFGNIILHRLAIFSILGLGNSSHFSTFWSVQVILFWRLCKLSHKSS